MTHRETGEMMVMKELICFDDETQKSFQTEVRMSVTYLYLYYYCELNLQELAGSSDL